MKLLFDQNLSHRLTEAVRNIFPGSIHVKDAGLDNTPDTMIWEYAKKEGFTIISKDSDFHQRSFLYGHPPKVIWIQKGNCTTDTISKIILNSISHIQKFDENPDSSFLILE